MGALNKEYIYSLLEDEVNSKSEIDREKSKKNLYNKYFVDTMSNTLSGVVGPRYSKLAGAIGTSMLGMTGKVGITGNYNRASEIAQHLGHGIDPTIIQSLGITPYLLSQFAASGSSANLMRKAELNYGATGDYGNYTNMISTGHTMSNLIKMGNLGMGGAAGLAALTGHGHLAAGLAASSPTGLAFHGLGSIAGALGLPPVLGNVLGGLMISLPTIMSATKLMKSPKKVNTFTQMPYLPGQIGKDLMRISNYNGFRFQIDLLKNQGLLKASEMLQLSLLNQIALHTSAGYYELLMEKDNQKNTFNTATRNKIANLYNPIYENVGDENVEKSWLTGRLKNLTPEEISKRKNTFTMNQTLNGITTLAISSILGPFSRLFTGKNFGEGFDDFIDILGGGLSSKARAHKEAQKQLGIPANAMQAFYTPATHWLHTPDYQSQMLGLTANIHEILRYSGLTLLDMNKVLGGKNKKSQSIYTLLEDLEDEYSIKSSEENDIDILTKHLGPVFSTLLKSIGTATVGTARIGMSASRLLASGITAPTSILIDRLFGTNYFDKLVEEIPDQFIKGIGNLKNSVSNPFKAIAAGHSKIKNTLLQRLGIISPDQIQEDFDNELSKQAEYDEKEAAYKFLGTHFPDITQDMLHELKQQSEYLRNLLECQNCNYNKLIKANKKWRGSEGEFLGANDYKDSLLGKVYNKLFDKYKLDEVKNQKFGRVSKLFYKMFGIKERDFENADASLNNIYNNYAMQEFMDPEEEFQEYIKINAGKYKDRRKSSEMSREERINRYRKRSLRNLNEDELQNALKEKEKREREEKRLKFFYKNIHKMTKQSLYLEKIFKYVKKQYEECCSKSNSTSSSSDLNILTTLGLIGGGWLLKKIRNKFKKQKPGETPEDEKPKGEPDEKPNEKPKPGEPKEKPKNKIKERVKERVKEKYKKTKIRIKEKYEDVKPKIREKLTKYHEGKLKLFKRIFLRVAEKFGKRELAEELLERLAAAITGTFIEALTTGPIGAVIGIIIDIGLSIWFLWDLWDVIVAAIREFRADLKLKKEANKLNNSPLIIPVNQLNEKQFSNLVTNNTADLGMYSSRGGQRRFDGKITFRADDEDEYLGYNLTSLEKVYASASHLHKFYKKDDKEKLKKFIEFKKYINDTKLEKVLEKSSGKEVQAAFNEFTNNFKQFQKDYGQYLQSSNALHGANIQLTGETAKILNEIKIAMSSVVSLLQQIRIELKASKIETITAVAQQ